MSAERIWELIARKLAGEASDEELHELDHLLRTHPDLHFSVQTISDLWQQQNEEVAEKEPQAAWKTHMSRMQEKGISFISAQEARDETARWQPEEKRKGRKALVRVLAAASLIVVCAWSLYLFRQGNRDNEVAVNPIATEQVHEISTQYGSRTTRQLPDGSRVWLNAGSKLVIGKAFGESLREVTLTGEAFFDVIKNREKPFIIHTPTIDVKVLGTQFNVKSYPADKTTETSLLRGSVEVVVKNRPNEKYVLKPNEKLVVLNEELTSDKNNTSTTDRMGNDNIIAIKSLTYQQGDTSAIEAAWIRNKLSVKDEPFIELAKKMERWYDVRFEFRNINVEDVFITGSFENETLEQALEALQFSFKFNYEINGNTVIVY